MEFSEEDLKTIAKALIIASNLTETEWLNLEKITIESFPSSKNENVNSSIREMWNQLYQKVERAMDKMKIKEEK